ncbi:uncharacterized protein LOC131230606 [Magnolia sinica]|uniref:uncharacterized protein LOC131230606 n=1 Tax=Magnolia sinica TaxID=86752 RepID=UPI0026599A71|nr:uncharacterized protein LOC131230606 [Magnolia sinica]
MREIERSGGKNSEKKSSAIDLSSFDRTATPGFLSDREVPNFGGSAISNVVSSGGGGGVTAYTDREVPNFGGSAISNAVSSGGGGGGGGGVAAVSSAPRASHEADSNGSSSIVSCHKCGEQFGKWEAAEAHHLSKHAD